MRNSVKHNNLLFEQNRSFEKLHKIVSDAIDAEELIILNITHPPVEIISRGQRISDVVAKFGGSWNFIIYFFLSYLAYGSHSISFPSVI